jgi:hypothetical protein
MPNAPRINILEVDQSFSVESLIKGVAAVMLKTQRGKYGVNTQLFSSWEQFKKEYGGEAVGYDGVTQAKRAIERGAVLRVYKVGHYTTISNPATLDAVKATIDITPTAFAMDGSDNVFNLLIKNPGANYNNLIVYIEAASNGDVDSFNLRIAHSIEPSLDELYTNIKIVGKPTIADSHYLDEVVTKSKFFDVDYKNINGMAAAAPFRPINGTWNMENGTDGGTIVDADYTGDSGAKTGVYAFGDYDDFEVMASLDNFTSAVHVAGSAVAANRQDFIYIASIPKANNTVALINTFRGGTLVDSRFTAFFAGGLKIQNPFTTESGGTPVEVSEIGDVIGAAMRSSTEFGPWWSFSEQQRGLVYNALGVVNNFGPNYTDLNSLALRQVNCVVNKGGRIYLTGNASAQLATSRKSFLSVVKLIIYLKKSLRGTLERYLGQPNDFRTFREIFNEVDPFLRGLVGNEKRALIDYEWRGDQYANTDKDLIVNTRTELDKGNYKVQLYLKEAVSLNELTLNIISSASGVSFEDLNN